jgi:hypothetical protein
MSTNLEIDLTNIILDVEKTTANKIEYYISNLFPLFFPFVIALFFGVFLVWFIPSFKIYRKKLISILFITSIISILIAVMSPSIFLLKDVGISLSMLIAFSMQSILLYVVFRGKISYIKLLLLSIGMAIGGILGIYGFWLLVFF